MHGHGKSDSPVVPAKPPNKAWAAEVVEERGLAEGNTDDPTRPGRRAGPGVPSGLDRVREVARKDKAAGFTALLHHVDVPRLWAAYWALNPKAATGVDGETWDSYGQNLEANLRDLHERVHSGRYQAGPTRRAYIPKADGRLRPLGIAAVEDKILQRAVVEVLNAIYEEDFLGFSYGFRPGRSPHDALDALAVGIKRKKVGWVLDADIRDFFTRLDHGWLAKFLEHRIADKRLLRLIAKWLNAGVIEDRRWTASDEGARAFPASEPPATLYERPNMHAVTFKLARSIRVFSGSAARSPRWMMFGAMAAIFRMPSSASLIPIANASRSLAASPPYVGNPSVRISRLRHFSASASSLRARKPPMFARPSFFADMMQPSASENISWAISFGVRSRWPGSRCLMNQAFSAKRQASRKNSLP